MSSSLFFQKQGQHLTTSPHLTTWEVDKIPSKTFLALVEVCDMTWLGIVSSYPQWPSNRTLWVWILFGLFSVVTLERKDDGKFEEMVCVPFAWAYWNAKDAKRKSLQGKNWRIGRVGGTKSLNTDPYIDMTWDVNRKHTYINKLPSPIIRSIILS